MQFCLNQKILVLIAGAESSIGGNNQPPEGHIDAAIANTPGKGGLRLRAEKPVVLIPPGVNASRPVHAYLGPFARRGRVWERRGRRGEKASFERHLVLDGSVSWGRCKLPARTMN